MTFSHESVKKCREDFQLSQECLMGDLAKNGVRVSRATLSAWESGKSIPDANALAALAMIFHKPIKYFFVSTVK